MNNKYILAHVIQLQEQIELKKGYQQCHQSESEEFLVMEQNDNRSIYSFASLYQWHLRCSLQGFLIGFIASEGPSYKFTTHIQAHSLELASQMKMHFPDPILIYSIRSKKCNAITSLCLPKMLPRFPTRIYSRHPISHLHGLPKKH